MPGYGPYRAFGAGRAKMRAPLDPDNDVVARPTKSPPPRQPAAGTDTCHTFYYTSVIVLVGRIMNIRRVRVTR